MNKVRNNVIKYSITVFIFLLLIFIYYCTTENNIANPYFFPKISKIMKAFDDSKDQMLENLIASFRLVIPSIFVSLIVGIGIGTIMGLNEWIRDSLHPIIYAFSVIPSILLSPFVLFLSPNITIASIILIVYNTLWATLFATITGVIFALAMVVKAFSKENECALIFNPEYVAFREVIDLNKRKIIESNLELENNRYYINYEDVEKKIKENDVKILMFCSPFNPCGRVWNKEELAKLAEICVDNNVIIVSDEIHMDFVWEGYKHIIFLDALKENKELYEKAKKLTIINTSASKTFNLAGLQVANTIIKDTTLKEKVESEIKKTGYHRISQPAQVALMAAYTEEGYHCVYELKKYIYNNILFVKDYIKKNIPKINVIETEGTYLMWLDFKEYGLNDYELQKKLINEAKVHLDSGLKFGSLGNGFMRMNIATSKNNIVQALNRIKDIFN